MLGAFWFILEPSWAILGPFWATSGFCGATLGHLGGFGSRHRFAKAFPPVSGPQWAIWGHLGAISGAKMVRVGPMMASRWPIWAHHGLKGSPDGLKMDQYGCKMTPTTPFLRVFFWKCSLILLCCGGLLRFAKTLFFSRFF